MFARELEGLSEGVAALRADAPDWRPRRELSPLDPLGPQPEDPWLTA
ncbi:hypothetical protein [Streptomyces sp. MUSC 14]|nr:hypothetical protein [Streptomyces sp. MUSC 14]